jgi:hypothetical protein
MVKLKSVLVMLVMMLVVEEAWGGKRGRIVGRSRRSGVSCWGEIVLAMEGVD